MPTSVRFRNDRVALVDERPFFLIGARHMPIGGIPSLLAGTGFNAYRHVAFSHEVLAADPLPTADVGLCFWSYVGYRTCFGKSSEYRRELEDHVRAVSQHPALLGYENLNEAAMLWKNRPPKALPEDLAEGTARLRELDPHHPIWLTHSCERTVETLAEYNPHGDIVGCNPYPVVPPGIRPHVGFRPDGRFLDCPDQTLHSVGRYTRKMRQVGSDGMPVWMLIQAMAHENWYHPEHTPEFAAAGIDPTKIVYPTAHEMRFMVFDAIISGATGLAFALWKTPIDSDAWRDVVQLVRELRCLECALTAPLFDESFSISYTDLGFTIWDGVQMLARRHGDDCYLFAANTSWDPARVVITMPDSVAANACSVEGEARELVIQDKKFSDDFAPFEIHVYRLGM